MIYYGHDQPVNITISRDAQYRKGFKSFDLKNDKSFFDASGQQSLQTSFRNTAERKDKLTSYGYGGNLNLGGINSSFNNESNHYDSRVDFTNLTLGPQSFDHKIYKTDYKEAQLKKKKRKKSAIEKEPR